MNIIVHGTVYQWQRKGGISRIYNELLPRICQLDPSISFHIVFEGPTLQKPPNHPQIRHTNLSQIGEFVLPERILRPLVTIPRRSVFQHYARRLGTRGSIWQSTDYTWIEGFRGPSVVTVYDTIRELFADMFRSPNDDFVRKRMRISIASADIIVCISETTRRDLLRLYQVEAGKTVVIPLAPGDSFVRSPAYLDNRQTNFQQPYLLYVGARGAGYKNFSALLDAYRTMTYCRTVALVVVGDATWNDPEREKMAQLGISNQVKLLTSVDDDELAALYRGAIAFVYPSLYEGFGIPLLEALACGCPVVASRIPSTMEVAGDVPIYFDPLSVPSLAAALDQAVEEAANTHRIHRGFELVRQYTWDESARRWLKVYRELDLNS